MTPKNRDPGGGKPKGDGSDGDGKPAKKHGSIDASKDMSDAQDKTKEVADKGRGQGDQSGPGPKGKDGGQSKAERDALIDEAQQQGHKINPDDVVHIGRDRNGKIVWLEKGTENAGLGHMMTDKRVGEFEKAGIPKEDIGEVAFRAATEGKPIGIVGRDRVVYEVEYNGETKRIAVTVGDNGFIVGANPVGNKKIKPLPDGGGG